MVGNVITGRAIYPSAESGFSVFVGLLIASKFFRSVGLFIAYDLLKLIPVVPFLFLLKAGTSVPLLILQKPFSPARKLTKQQCFRVIRHAFFSSFISFLWLFGLTLCGPLRTILLFEHSDLVIVAGFTALFTSNGGGPAKLRGGVFFILAVLAVLLFDHDDMLTADPDHLHSTFVSHVFHHIITHIGWSDHKGGVVLLAITLCLQVGFNSASKKLSVDIGGSKRLHALSTVMSTMLLLPWAVFIYFTRESDIQSLVYILFPLALVIFFMFVFDYYIEVVAVNHLHPPNAALVATLTMLVSAVFLSATWNHPLMAQVTTLHKMRDIITEDHVLSGGVVFSVIIMMFSTRLLLAPSRGARGSFIGYSPAGLPLYSIAGDALQRTTHTVFMVLKNGLRQILEESDSRKIFYFLCINLAFTFVELTYGVWTNSLGLISDGFHMLFDCSALVMGLYAAVMSRWKATRIFSYGFDRVEVLSGFINGLFLIVIGIFVFAEAIGRLFEPPEIHTERLLTVSIMGLLVNLTGIFVFKSAHGHSHGGHGHSHGGHAHSQNTGGHGHGHSHGGHGHSHAGQGDHSLWGGEEHSHSQPQGGHNTNMEGVFLHVLADTLGSVGVIISTLLIENFGWNIADPLCSLFIATMILLSVFPLLKETSMILLLRTPTDMKKEIALCLDKVLLVEGVLTYREPHIWWHTSAKVMVALHVQVTPETSEQKIVAQVCSIFKEIGITNVTIQVEKESYFQHLSGLGTIPEQMFDFTLNFQHQNQSDSLFSGVKAI